MSSNTYSFGSVGIFLTYNHHTCLYIWCISQVVTILINACVWSDFVITQAFFSFLLHGHSIESTEGERGAHRTAAEGARPWEGRGRPGRRPGRWGGQSWQYFTLHITFVKQRYWKERENYKLYWSLLRHYTSIVKYICKWHSGNMRERIRKRERSFMKNMKNKVLPGLITIDI